MRTRLFSLALLLSAAAAAVLVWTFVPQNLSVPTGPSAGLPAYEAVPGVSLSRVATASIESPIGLSVRGGSMRQPFTSAMVAFVVHHPQGDLLIDAGVARRGVEHFPKKPALMRMLVELNVTAGIADALVAGGVEPDSLAGVVLTHTHWDHVSGLEDLPPLPVWLTADEQAYTEHDAHALLFRTLDADRPIDVRTLSWSNKPYGPFDRSWDVYDDGAVVVVPLPGHTPGSVGIFVNLPSGQRVLFIGDTSWTREGVDWPAQKPWLSRSLVDKAPEVLAEQLVVLHRLDHLHSDLLLVPAHDARVHQAIPALPNAMQ